jgi:HSP20 family protein
MTLIKFKNANGNSALLPGFNDVFPSIFNDTLFSDRVTSKSPAVNISESPEAYHIELAAPGLKKQDFKINIEYPLLSVSVEQQEETTETSKKYNKREFSYDSFVRSFNLPELADHNQIEAVYEDGILKINVAKKEESKTLSRQIEIK